jgi:serine/threonine-protein kinase HipA
MSLEVHIDWQGQTHFVGRLHAAERGSSVSFEYAIEWLQRDGAFAIDPTSLPLQRGAHHAATLFGAIQDCGPDRWGRVLIERAVRKKVLAQKPYHEIDYVLALDDASRIGALRFRLDAKSPFLAITSGKLPPLVRLNALLHATDGQNQRSVWPTTGSPSQNFPSRMIRGTLLRAKFSRLHLRHRRTSKLQNIGSYL